MDVRVCRCFSFQGYEKGLTKITGNRTRENKLVEYTAKVNTWGTRSVRPGEHRLCPRSFSRFGPILCIEYSDVLHMLYIPLGLHVLSVLHLIHYRYKCIVSLDDAQNGAGTPGDRTQEAAKPRRGKREREQGGTLELGDAPSH